MGYSCGDILHECCITFPDKSFVLWLCTRLYFLDNGYCGFWGNDLAIQTQPLTRDYLLSFAKDKGYNDIVRYLRKQWLDDILCVNPMTYNFVLVSALFGDRLLETRALILRVLILLQIANKNDDEFRNLVKFVEEALLMLMRFFALVVQLKNVWLMKDMLKRATMIVDPQLVMS